LIVDASLRASSRNQTLLDVGGERTFDQSSASVSPCAAVDSGVRARQ
jgi:hypothetical protein